MMKQKALVLINWGKSNCVEKVPQKLFDFWVEKKKLWRQINWMKTEIEIETWKKWFPKHEEISSNHRIKQRENPH